jgi:dipeptidyl aminopeptidase/acylaminoacyl peptidase
LIIGGIKLENIKIDDFLKFKAISGIEHCENGENACFVVHEMDLEENKYLSNLWIWNKKDNSYYQLTSFNSEKSFLWIDNENILFPDIRDSKDKEKLEVGERFTQYYKISIHGGEAVKALRIPASVSSLKLVDEDTFAFTAEFNNNEKDLNSFTDDERAKELKLLKEEKDYEVLEEIPFWSNGGGFTSKKRNRLYIYHIEEKQIEAVTDENTNVDVFNFNKDKTKMVVIYNTFTDKMGLVSEMKIYDVVNKEITKIENTDELSYYYADFLQDDKNTILFTGSNMKNYGLNENEKFFTLDFASNEIKCITPELDMTITNSVGSDIRYGSSKLKQVDGEHLYFVSTEGYYSYLNRINKTGQIERLTESDGSVDGISINKGRVLYIGMKSNKLQSLYSIIDKKETEITSFNSWVYNEKHISPVEKFCFETVPGEIIDGWIIKPSDYDETKKYPAILDIHGGPKTVYGTVYFHEMQYWASLGYAVIFCNPRGSDGKGNDFADIRGKYGTIDYDDLMRFVDVALEKYNFIDAHRVGVTGGSYGGFMTNWIIGHTDRFKAAVSQRSISNWISKFCTTEIGYFFVNDQISGTPWDNQEGLWKQSPLKYADKVKTPTLFIHSEEDYRCWLAEGIQMFTALKYHGVESRLCMFRGENHELNRSGKPKHKLRNLKEMTDWFESHLK